MAHGKLQSDASLFTGIGDVSRILRDMARKRTVKGFFRTNIREPDYRNRPCDDDPPNARNLAGRLQYPTVLLTAGLIN
jgi:hypothetical protein